jgi:hypothetical protein
MRTRHEHRAKEETMSCRIVSAIGLGLLLACAASSALAGSQERKGTGGAVELRLPVGARGTALGSSAVADAMGVEGMFWNPAGLASMDRTEALFSHTNYIADMNVDWAAVGVNLKGVGCLGFQVKVLSIGDIIVTTEDAPEGTGEIISPTFTVLGVTYARQFTDRVLFGGTLSYISERILNSDAQGVAADLGVQYLTGWHGLKFGVVMKNFGPSMTFSGEDFETPLPPPGADPNARDRIYSSGSAEFELPSYFSLGATYAVYQSAEHKVSVLGAFQNNNFLGDYLAGAAEWSYRDRLAVRGSLFGAFRGRPDAVGGDAGVALRVGDDTFDGYALGAGFKLPIGGTTNLGVDIAWRSVREYFEDTLEIGVKLGF